MTKIVRTPTRAKGGITEAERAAMAEHVKLWTARAFRTEPADPAKLVPAIEGIYAAAKLKKPRVVIASSPLVMAFAYGAAAAIWHHRKTGFPLDDATDAATDAATRAATRAATDAATDAAAKGAAEACYAIAGTMGLECAKEWRRIYQGGAYWAAYDSYLSAARDILGLRLPAHEAYTFWEQAAIHGAFRVMHEEFCIVSDFPEVLKVDDENRPHCEDGPSHRWRDGWSLYHWHGVQVPREWIEDKVSLTARTALTWENVEQRRAACEIVGWARIVDELGGRIIDDDPDPEIGSLIAVTLPGDDEEPEVPARFLRVKCGTGRDFAICVPETVTTAIEAQAWMLGLPATTFLKPEVRT